MIRGIATDDVTFARAKEFVETLGKTTAVSEDFPAFMVNRGFTTADDQRGGLHAL